MSSHTKTIRDAATIMLVRDRLEGLEVFMLERPSRGVFPGLTVFPGGKVDADDAEIAFRHSAARDAPAWHDGLETRFRVAAIRECFEECGVFVARPKPIRQINANGERTNLLNGSITFKELLIRDDIELLLDELLYFAHWITPATAPARFNARFFVARMPEAQETEHYTGETNNGLWVRPEVALQKYAEGKWSMISPTITNLRMICAYSNVTHLLNTVRSGKHRIPITRKLHEGGYQYYPGSWRSA